MTQSAPELRHSVGVAGHHRRNRQEEAIGQPESFRALVNKTLLGESNGYLALNKALFMGGVRWGGEMVLSKKNEIGQHHCFESRHCRTCAFAFYGCPICNRSGCNFPKFWESKHNQ